MRARQIEEEEIAVDPVAIEAMLRDSLDRWGIEMTGDQRVDEETAARLIGYSALYTRNLRQLGRGPDPVKLRGRVWYRLPDVARWLAENIEPF